MGGEGNDIATFNGTLSDYTLNVHDGYIVISANAHPQQQATLINIESLKFSDTTVSVDNRTALTSLSGLYQDVLGRQADWLGFAYWGNQQKNGVSLGQIAIDIMQSQESQALHAIVFNGNAAHDIDLLYQGIFNRASDSAGLAYWVNQMQHGMTLERVATNFVLAPEMTGHNISAQNWDFLA
ncbi:DUF4214 domain-containing protein [Undibacterium sp. TJN25]|uniref:DUF4214 domain-containing protein n=1 Tax=Undibacterium sp. TJN25 TaxID=3413056 RepID=UPI003BF36260